MVYATDRFKVLDLVVFFFFVFFFLDFCLSLRGLSCWVLPCSLFSCFSVLFSIVITSLLGWEGWSVYFSCMCICLTVTVCLSATQSIEFMNDSHVKRKKLFHPGCRILPMIFFSSFVLFFIQALSGVSLISKTDFLIDNVRSLDMFDWLKHGTSGPWSFVMNH